MKAVELFAGIGGFRIALDRLGIETVWANELDAGAARVYAGNFGNANLVVENIRDIPVSAIPDTDIVTAGFPCQSFSAAGKKMGIDCIRNGDLFQEVIRVLEAKRPRYFILENVERLVIMENSLHFKAILSQLSRLDYIIEWRVIDAARLGMAQVRRRVFITGRRVDNSSDTHFDISTSSVLSDADDAFMEQFGNQPLSALLVPIDSHGKARMWGMAHDGRMLTSDALRFRSAPAITLEQVLQSPDEVPSVFDFTQDTLVRLENSINVDKYHNGVQILWNQRGGARFGYTVFGTKGLVSTLTASSSRHYERYQVGPIFRRLTNVEYARLMGFPDQWCRMVPVHGQYPLYGNAVVPNCVEWVARRLFGATG